MGSPFLRRTLKTLLLTAGIPVLLYVLVIASLLAFPSLETHAVYLHRLTLTPSAAALNTPERFGFQHNQVRPFSIPSTRPLHAWHVLPLGTYRAHEAALLAEAGVAADGSAGGAGSRTGSPGNSNNGRIAAGYVTDVTRTLGFRLLRSDPAARLVIHFHGASGTVASMHRPDCYRALSAGAPDRIHVLAVDYRGYGLSDGVPSERGVIEDAVATVRWAVETAGVAPERIVLHGQSLGSAVAISTAEHFAARRPPVAFAGLVATAPFSDAVTLAATYRINGVVPILDPLSRFPGLVAAITGRLRDRWSNVERLPRLVAALPRYHVELLHAEDDPVIPCAHTHSLFRSTLNATSAGRGMSADAAEGLAEQSRVDRGHAGGSVWEWRSREGIIRKEILRYGLHDVLMTFPSTSRAIMRAFESRDAGCLGRGDNP